MTKVKRNTIIASIIGLFLGTISAIALYFAIEAIKWREIARLREIRIINDNPNNYLIAIQSEGETYYFSRYGRKCHENEQPKCVERIKEEFGIVTFVGCQKWSCLEEK